MSTTHNSNLKIPKTHESNLKMSTIDDSNFKNNLQPMTVT